MSRQAMSDPLDRLQIIHDRLVGYPPNQEACRVLQIAIDNARRQPDRISRLAGIYLAETLAGAIIGGRQ